jgi:RNA polymerase sigma-70 factor (ECF subfamily)
VDDGLLGWLSLSDAEATGAVRDDLAARRGDLARLAEVLDPLAGLAADGDQTALELVLWAVDALRLARPTIMALVLDEADADDVNQDVLIAVAEGIRSYEGKSRFTTWLHPIARHKAVDTLRRRRRSDTLADDMGDVARISSVIATRTVLDQAIASIPDPYRDAVVLRDIEGLTYEQVSDRLGVKLNTVRTRIARGRAIAAAMLSSAEHGSGP